MKNLALNQNVYLARLGKSHWWRAKVAAVRRRTSNSSARTPTRTTAADFHDVGLSGAGAAAQKRTGRSSGIADPSPCSMSRDKSS